jgi:hypothetical protein
LSNATYFWLIPLHPLGEMNMLDYYIADNEPDEKHKRFIGNGGQIIYYASVT